MSGGARAGAAVAVLCGVQFVDVLGVTSTTTALPAVVADLGAPRWTVGVLATTYAACFGGLLVLGARLGDRLGHRRVLLAGLLLFGCAGPLGATASHVAQVVCALALQGSAAALSVPSALRLLMLVAGSGAQRTTAVAAWGATGAAAGALGFVVGGLLTEGIGWPAIFWVNAPIAVVLGVLVSARIPVAPPEPALRSLDGLGAVLLVGAVMTAVFGASLAEEAPLRAVGCALLVAAAVFAVLFALRQRTARTPLIPPRALADRNLRTGAGLSLVNTATTSSTGVLVTLHLQERLGAGPLEAGLRLLPFSLAVVIGSSGVRRLHGRLRHRQIAGLGLLLVAGGNAVLAVGNGHAGLLVAVVLAGLGLGPAAAAATTIGTDVPAALGGTASGVVNTAAQLGTALGVACFVGLASFAGTDHGLTLAAAGIAVLAAGTAVASLRRGGVGVSVPA